MTGLRVKVITTIPCCRLQDFLPILWLEHIVHRSLDPRFPRPFFLTTARFFYGLPLKPSTETKASFMPYSNMPGYPVSPVCCSSILDNLAFSITPMLLCLRASVNTIPHPLLSSHTRENLRNSPWASLGLADDAAICFAESRNCAARKAADIWVCCLWGLPGFQFKVLCFLRSPR